MFVGLLHCNGHAEFGQIQTNFNSKGAVTMTVLTAQQAVQHHNVLAHSWAS